MRPCQSRVLVPFQINKKASRRGQSKLSGRLERVNLRDVQHAICCTDNRKGWRAFALPVQKIFRIPSQGIRKSSSENSRQKEEKGENQLGNKLKPSFLGLRNFPKLKRPRNGAIDLVGVELNPGPNKKQKKPQKQVQKGKSKVKKVVRTIKQSPSSGFSREAGAYLKTVLAPCAGNARIPDLNTIPTVLATITQEFVLSANAQGCIGFDAVLGSASQYYSEGATSADGAFVYGSVSTFTGATALAATYGYLRLVSACVDVSYTGATATDQGLIVGWTGTAFGGTSEINGLLSTLTAALITRSNKTNPLREGMSLFYRPSDSTAFAFKASSSNTQVGRLGFHVSGAATSAPVFVKVTINCECIPTSDTSTAGTTVSGGSKPSPVDPAGVAKAISLATSIPPITTFHRARDAVDKMTNVSNDLMTVWNAGRQAFGSLQQYGKLLL